MKMFKKIGLLLKNIFSKKLPYGSGSKDTRPYGMQPNAYNAYKMAVINSELDFIPRIVQVVGNAKASKGFHHLDGYFTNESGKKEPYCAAIDISVRGLSLLQIKKLLHNMARQGFVPFYRYRGSFALNKHIHAVYVKCKMKPQLASQVEEFTQRDGDGLVGNAKEVFYTSPKELDAYLYSEYKKYNP